MDLHGTRTKETDSTTKAVTTVNMSVIGLVGTAPGAIAGVAASITTGSTIMDTAIVFTATEMGVAGNQLRVTAIPADADAPETIASFLDDTLTIALKTDATGESVATAADVVTAVAAVAASQIIAALYPGISGAGIVDPFAAITLQGGEDEPFPLYTPALISGSSTQAKKLGTSGTLYADTVDILAQAGALMIVVRVEDNTDEEQQIANILQGISALEISQGLLNYQPRILIAPEWSTDDGVGKALESMANKLRAVTYLDSVSMATAESVARRGQMYGGRVEILRPRIMVTDSVTGAVVSRPYSAAAAGHRIRIDVQNGWWWSKSNQDVYGFVGLEQTDSFIIGDEMCVANQLNQANVSTIVMLGGFRHWGNRLCISDPQYRFESVRRSADALQDSIQLMVTKNYIDRPVDKALSISLVGSINSYLRQEKTRGAINGGRAWPDPELNTAESLAAGKVYVNVAFAPKSPAEEIIITYSIDNTYTVSEFTGAAA